MNDSVKWGRIHFLQEIVSGPFIAHGSRQNAADPSQHGRWLAGGRFQDYANLRVAQLQLLEGKRETAEHLLKQVEANALRAISNGHEAWFHRWNLVFVYSLKGESDKALDWFEQAVDSGRRRYEWDELEPAFRPINDDPRFQAGLQRQRDLRQEMKRNTAAILGKTVLVPVDARQADR